MEVATNAIFMTYGKEYECLEKKNPILLISNYMTFMHNSLKFLMKKSF